MLLPLFIVLLFSLFFLFFSAQTSIKNLNFFGLFITGFVLVYSCVLYINFDFMGIPEDLPIENIEIREKPEETKKIKLDHQEDKITKEETKFLLEDTDDLTFFYLYFVLKH